jgi:hypothetical protein
MKRIVTNHVSTWLALAFLLPPLGAAEAGQGPAGTVTISRPDYDRMLDLAARDLRPADIAPLGAALTRADIRARVAAGVVRATMQVDGEVFRAGSVKVPLITGATLIEARLAGGALPLITEGATHVAVMTGPSTFSATLEWGAPLTTTPGRGSFVLPVPPAGSATATFDVPGEQTDVRVAPGLVLRRISTNGRTLVEATLDPGSPTQVWWSTRETAPSGAPREVRMLSDVKTLVTIGDADLRLLTLVDVTVVQGDPSEIEIRIPAGYEVTRVTGASLERSEDRPDRVVAFVTNPAQRKHQFLLSLERAGGGGSFKLDTGFATLPAAQRETGEVAVEGLGTLAVSAVDTPGMRRMDVREIDPALASAARQSILAAFRYQRVADAPPPLALDVTRFPDAAVLAAVAERAVATTLVTGEGRALTEVSLWIRNRAQPFVKVALPPGASMVSVEVAGAAAKPVEGKDGTRVPLLRPGFRPDGAYSVSFVYLHAGAPFDRKGHMQMTLPKMDLPVSVVEWELFIPDRYRADRFDGNAIPAGLIEMIGSGSGVGSGFGSGVGPGVAGSVAGGAVGGRVAGLQESVTVTAQSPQVNVHSSESSATLRTDEIDVNAKAQRQAVNDAPSANVQSLQRRAAGVLPVRIEVPRAGTSHRFIKPLVVEEETLVSFRYRRLGN